MLGDPSLGGLVVSFLYLGLIVSSFRLGFLKQAQCDRLCRRLFPAFVLLGINKQLDLQTPFIDLMRRFAFRTQLTSDIPRTKTAFLVFVAILVILFLWFLLNAIREKGHLVVLLGFHALLLFLGFRVAETLRLAAHNERVLPVNLIEGVCLVWIALGLWFLSKNRHRPPILENS